ncbi:hypothetical protein SPRG_01188 [Saprolegnia parasitica CBS 223.65]|uniref:Uncharacterized protein n=1 Tax=Saprolegnia parasitica (strain CBS 223.65) TaxID=695850 RepID=A0A067D912_SAPPC|nr:hypothetical protein SPRG_01188 [Saprolegnia parasitica CBS 223.65]KDO35121.1 hypothetical protein SPRG_01188 [Saprolegnia parasitica CBS 223.65]|eukprot:XP_012194770.1 hypothetical protein SPRG_01188 [Saprolegnia parasitica CBS 223.65]
MHYPYAPRNRRRLARMVERPNAAQKRHATRLTTVWTLWRSTMRTKMLTAKAPQAGRKAAPKEAMNAIHFDELDLASSQRFISIPLRPMDT